ncbi:hypothetical protein AB0H57_30580 [Micromonospora sp. NPDC050686]|uniref:hypothetical protein n=1 Tax=Micromonospora sp. NPDC050686 TaxID=3154631 RepID=UPI0033D92E1D
MAGAVVLALVGSPQSPEMLFLTGPDSPAHIGPQLAIALSGAAAMAVAVLLDRLEVAGHRRGERCGGRLGDPHTAVTKG